MLVMKRAGEDRDFQRSEMKGSGSSIYSHQFAEKAKFIECYDSWHSCFSVDAGPNLPSDLGAMLELDPYSLAKKLFLFLLESRLQVFLVYDADIGRRKLILHDTLGIELDHITRKSLFMVDFSLLIASVDIMRYCKYIFVTTQKPGTFHI